MSIELSDSEKTARDHRSHSVPIAWNDWTEDTDTKTKLNQLLAELGFSIRLSGDIGVPKEPINQHSLTAQIGLDRGRRRRGRPPNLKAYEDIAFRLLLNVLRVAGYDPAVWVGYSRTAGDYTKRSLFPESVTYARVLKVVRWFKEIGWLDLEPGYFNYAGKYGYQSLLRATPKLVSSLAGFKVVVLQGALGDFDLVRMRDDRGIRMYDYPITGDVGVWIGKLRRINQQIATSHLGFDLSVERKRAMFADLRTRRCAPDLSRTQLYRSFNNNDWTQGGRFYGGWWINLPSEYRQFITINNEPTVEPDFSSYHISMLYGARGTAIPDGDLYDIGWPAHYRDLVKVFVNALLNASDQNSAMRAVQDYREDGTRELWDRFRDDPIFTKHGSNRTKLLIAMLDAIRIKHAAIADKFGSGEGVSLQFRDSQIAELVLMSGVFANVTILPVHDSFIIPRQHATEYQEMMRLTFHAHYAQSIVVK